MKEGTHNRLQIRGKPHPTKTQIRIPHHLCVTLRRRLLSARVFLDCRHVFLAWGYVSEVCLDGDVGDTGDVALRVEGRVG